MVFTIVVAVVVAAIAHASWAFRERVVLLHVESPAPLTDQQAVALSREALARVGEDAAQFTPEPFKGEGFYARNAKNPYSGYVLWISPDKSRPGFGVNLEQSGTNVRCGVGREK